MIKIGDALLDKHALVLELAQGVAAHAPEHRAELVRVVHFLNAHAAAARRSLNQHQRPLNALLGLELENIFGDVLGFHLIVDGPV